MAVLRAVVSDRDGIVHELELKKRDQNAAYSWYFGDVALVITPAATPEDAIRNLKREVSQTPDDPVQLISIVRSGEDQIF